MINFRKMLAALLALLLALGCTSSLAEGNEWICPGCGAANSENFCTKCGVQKPEQIVCPDCGAKYPPDSGAVFCGNCGTKLQQTVSFSGRYEGEGFSSPEEALTCYMEGLKNLDFEQMLSAFAWETQMEHYDFKAFFERVRAYQPTMRPRMPSVNDFMFSANVNIIRCYQADLIYRSLELYILGDDAPSRQKTGTIAFRKDSDDVDAFLQRFENGRLEKLTQMSGLRFLQPDDVTDGKFSVGLNPEQFIRQTACYGADEAVNLLGAAEIGDETLYCCPTICRYGDKWYLVSLSSMTGMILGIPTDCQAFICGSGSLKNIIR